MYKICYGWTVYIITEFSSVISLGIFVLVKMNHTSMISHTTLDELTLKVNRMEEDGRNTNCCVTEVHLKSPPSIETINYSFLCLITFPLAVTDSGDSYWTLQSLPDPPSLFHLTMSPEPPSQEHSCGLGLPLVLRSQRTKTSTCKSRWGGRKVQRQKRSIWVSLVSLSLWTELTYLSI